MGRHPSRRLRPRLLALPAGKHWANPHSTPTSANRSRRPRPTRSSPTSARQTPTPHRPETTSTSRPPASRSPACATRYQQALTDYLTARDAYYNQDSPWHAHARANLDQLTRHGDHLQPAQDQLQAAQARLEAVRRDGDLTGLATAQQQWLAAQQAAPDAQLTLAAAADDVLAHADRLALDEVNQLHQQLQALQAELDQATAPETADLSAELRWQQLVASINPDLVDHVLYPQLAAAIDRAHNAGHDMATQLPQIAAHDYATRDPGELMWRLYADYPDAVPDLDLDPMRHRAEQPSPAVPPWRPDYLEPPTPSSGPDGPAR